MPLDAPIWCYDFNIFIFLAATTLATHDVNAGHIKRGECCGDGGNDDDEFEDRRKRNENATMVDVPADCHHHTPSSPMMWRR